MKEEIFALCDLEENFAFRMAEYIVEKVPMPYALHLFTKTEKLQIFMESHKIVILLISESAIRSLGSEVDVPNVFVLQENEKTAEEKAAEAGIKAEGKMALGWHYIDKFQSPQRIIGELAEHMAQRQGWEEAKSAKDTRLKIIGVYSPVKRCLQTSFALTMGQLLSREHKTLYLNFECYSGFAQMLKKEYPEDMLDVLYYFKCASEKLSVRLSSIVQNINGLDFIPPGQAGLDMQGISAEKWIELLEMIEKISDYEYLILDLSDGMNGLFELLSRCYKIYTITGNDGFAMAKMHQYEQILQLNELHDIAGKTVKCKFPFFEKLPSDISLMTHGELAGYVKAIIQEDLYEKQTG
ncbi:MAG: hypothetical protein NC321_00690 [Clostridium sp.]|nr:hypothetical protein [Lachnoclostridium sp.]MCM1251315.1 hypothetical protein [Clostridium sp.]